MLGNGPHSIRAPLSIRLSACIIAAEGSAYVSGQVDYSCKKGLWPNPLCNALHSRKHHRSIDLVSTLPAVDVLFAGVLSLPL